MPKIVKPLTDARIRNEKTKAMLSDGGGLMLLVGKKTWVWRYTMGDRRRDMSLGRYPDVSLEAAREEVRRWRAVLLQGGDPHRERDQARRPTTVPTFGECADQYIDTHKSGWRLRDGGSKHLDQWRRSLEVQAKAIRNRPVNEIDTAAVLSVVKPIWTRAQVTGDRLRNRIELVLEMARADGHIPEDRPNPARWRGWLEHKLPKAQKGEDKHFAAMPHDDAPSFLDRLRTSGAGAALALEFVVLTGVRVNEALGARRSEFDLEARVWTIPADRMKANRVHVVPLSVRAVEIVRSEMARHADELVFRGQKKGIAWNDQSLRDLLPKGEGWTVHGFRSSLRDFLWEVLGADRDLAEACLAHTVQGVEGDYRRGPALERRRALMDAWSQHCTRGQPADNVVALKRA
jgi:integrase